MILYTNKNLEDKIKYLEKLIDESTALVETIKAYRNNKSVLLLEDLNEVVLSKLQSLCDDNHVIVLFTKDGKRIEIHCKEDIDKPEKRKNYF